MGRIIEDKYGRRFKKLRVSLVNTCNFACVYCVRDAKENLFQDIEPDSGERQLTVDEFGKTIHAVHQLVGLDSVRLTGGEPLLYRHLTELIEKIRLIGIDDIRLTTNAYYLKQKAESLKNAGIRSVNVSLDALDVNLARKISRHGQPQKALEGIEAAVNQGMEVKLNTVVMKGINDSQIIPLLEYAASLGVKIRYLELMKMGHLYKEQTESFFSEREILDTIRAHYSIRELPRKKSETARYWKAGGKGVFGIIANESSPFCHDCNRLRMDSRGYFYGCLSNANGDKLLPYINQKDELSDKLQQLLLLKQNVKFNGSKLSMKYIGG